MTRKFRNSICWLILSVVSVHLQGQSIKYEAKIDPINKAGFYAIYVTPALSGYFKTDFSDLRINDEKNNPVPWILGSHISALNPDLFRPFKIISNRMIGSGKTMLIIENKPAAQIDAIYLRIKNAAVNRTLSLSGSEDMNNWFSIEENIGLEKRFVRDNDSYVEKIAFPLSSYRYFRITVYNGKNDPLNIIEAEHKTKGDSVSSSSFIENPREPYLRNDSTDQISYLTILNPGTYHISRIGMHIKGPKFFQRHVDLLHKQQLLGSFLISSDSVFNFFVPVFNDSSFQLRVYNEDNAPLDIGDVITAQDAEKIITWLEPGIHYRLKMTGEKMESPHYDLLNFKDSIPLIIPALTISDIEPVAINNPVPDKGFFKKNWLWPVMIIVLLLLIFFTVRLVRDIQNRV
jgi:hypothetical protein